MSIITATLEATVRLGSGKGFARRTRMSGMVPAIIYGKHLATPILIAVYSKDIKSAIATPKKLNTVLGLRVNERQHMVLLKDYQLDPVSRELQHVDFIAVQESVPVKVKVPMVLVGKSRGIIEGGILTQMRREIEVWALPAVIPQQLEADVSEMRIGSVLHINDLKMPEGVRLRTDLNYTIAVCMAPETDKAAAAQIAESTATT